MLQTIMRTINEGVTSPRLGDCRSGGDEFYKARYYLVRYLSARCEAEGLALKYCRVDGGKMLENVRCMIDRRPVNTINTLIYDAEVFEEFIELMRMGLGEDAYEDDLKTLVHEMDVTRDAKLNELREKYPSKKDDEHTSSEQVSFDKMEENLTKLEEGRKLLAKFNMEKEV